MSGQQDMASGDCFSNVYRGFQDARPLALGLRRFYLFLNDYTEDMSRMAIWLGAIDLTSSGQPIFAQPTALPTPLAARVEKNWAPLTVSGHTIIVVYSLSPYRTAAVNTQAHTVDMIATNETLSFLPQNWPLLSPGTNAVHLNGSLVALAHFYTRGPLNGLFGVRRYRHVLYACSPHPPYRIHSVSQPFTLFEDGTSNEFAIGLEAGPNGLLV